MPLGQPLDYDPFEAPTYTLGAPLDYDPFEDEGSLTGDIGRALGSGAVEAVGRSVRGLGETYDVAKRAIERPLVSGLESVGLKAVGDFLTKPQLPWWTNPAEILRRPGEQVMRGAEAVKPPPERQNIATDIAGGVGQLIAQVTAALLSGGASSMTSLASMFGQGVDIQRGLIEEYAPERKGDIDTDTAMLTGGAITALTERFGLGKVLDRVPPKIKNSVIRYLADVGIAGGIEAAQEVTEGVMQNLLAAKVYAPDLPILEGLDREAIAAGGAGTVARGLVNLALPGRAPITQEDRESPLPDDLISEGEALFGGADKTGGGEVGLPALPPPRMIVTPEGQAMAEGAVLDERQAGQEPGTSRTFPETEEEPALAALPPPRSFVTPQGQAMTTAQAAEQMTRLPDEVQAGVEPGTARVFEQETTDAEQEATQTQTQIKAPAQAPQGDVLRTGSRTDDVVAPADEGTPARGAPPSPTAVEGLVLRKSGEPWSTENAARASAGQRPDLKGRGYVPVQVDGGWGLQPSAPQAESTVPSAQTQPSTTRQNLERRRLVRAPDGKVDWGRIPDRTAMESRGAVKALPIRVQQGDDTFGYRHVEASKTARVRKMGFESLDAFLGFVAKNFNMVVRQPNGRIALVVSPGRGTKRGKPVNNYMAVEIVEEQGYYGLTTVVPDADDAYLTSGGKEILWRRGAVPAQSGLGGRTPYKPTTEASPIRSGVGQLGQSLENIEQGPETGKAAPTAGVLPAREPEKIGTDERQPTAQKDKPQQRVADAVPGRTPAEEGETTTELKEAVSRRDFIRTTAGAAATVITFGNRSFAFTQSLTDYLRSDGATLKGALQHIAETSQSADIRRLAFTLASKLDDGTVLKIIPVGVQLEEKVPASLNSARGVTTRRARDNAITVYLRDDTDEAFNGLNEETVVHEAIHVATLRGFGDFRERVNRTAREGASKALEEGAMRLIEIRNRLIDRVNAMSRAGREKLLEAPWFEAALGPDPDEFIAYAMSHSEFQAWLKSIPWDGPVTRKVTDPKKSMWARFVDAVRSMLSAISVRRTYFDEAMDAGYVVLENLDASGFQAGKSEEAGSDEKLSIASDTTMDRVPDVPVKSPGLKQRYERAAQKLIDRVAGSLGWRFDPLGNLPEKRAYLIRRYLTLGRIAKVDEYVGRLYKALSTADEKDARSIYDYLTTKDARPTRISPRLRSHAIFVKEGLDKVGRQLVERGLLSQETYEANAGTYLPRVYLKHVLGEGNMAALGSGKKVSDLGYLKKRKDIDEETRMLILGEITDPAFLGATGLAKPMRDVAILDFLNDISGNRNWIQPQSVVQWKGKTVSAMWLRDEAKSVAEMAALYPDKTRRDQALALAKQMRETAEEALESIPGDLDDYRQVPDSKRYGALKGAWIRKEIFDDLIGTAGLKSSDPGILESILETGGIGTKITQWWKLGKVALNPPSQIRNFISNAVLMHLSGVPLVRVPERVVQAVSEIKNNGRHWKVAQKYGVTASTFASQEMATIHAQLLDIQSKHGGPMGQLKAMGGAIAKAGGDLYQVSESIFKTAKIIDAMEREGMSEQDAALAAQDALFDYSLVPKWVRYLRNAPFGVPFLTFQYKALPQILRVAVKHPWRFTPYVAAIYGLSEAIQELYDVDDDDLEKLKKALPQWLQDRGHAYLLPYKDQLGRWQAVDFGYFFPWTMATELFGEAARGELGKAVGTLGFFGGPLPDLLAAITTGVDSFTGRPIYDSLDPPAKQMRDMMTYVWRLAMPTWLTDIGLAGKLLETYRGTGMDRRGNPLPTEAQAWLRAAGINIYPIDPEGTRADNIRRMEYEIQQAKARLTRVAKDQSLTEKERNRSLDEHSANIQRLADRLAEYIDTSEVHPNLRAGSP